MIFENFHKSIIISASSDSIVKSMRTYIKKPGTLTPPWYSHSEPPIIIKTKEIPDSLPDENILIKE
ncbi:MAG: hypothetical protein ACEPOZ_02345 [Marinifilaceae bacterium]